MSRCSRGGLFPVEIEAMKVGGVWYAWPRFLPRFACCDRLKRDAVAKARRRHMKTRRDRLVDDRIRWWLMDRRTYHRSNHPAAVGYRKRFDKYHKIHIKV